MSICDQCGEKAFRLFFVGDKWLCEKCYPLGKFNRWTWREKIKSRTLMPDGTVLQGRQGIKVKDERLRRQNNENRRLFTD